MASHEQLSSSLILSIIASSSGCHGTRFLLDCNAIGRTLECATMLRGVAASADVSLLERMPNASERTGRWRCSGTCDN
jgi:hypothetical protein